VSQFEGMLGRDVERLPFDRMVEFTRRVIAVPKSEIPSPKQARKKPKRRRKPVK